MRKIPDGETTQCFKYSYIIDFVYNSNFVWITFAVCG